MKIFWWETHLTLSLVFISLTIFRKIKDFGIRPEFDNHLANY